MHDALDKLETTNIPMQPDCTVSLNVSPRMRQALRATKSELSHCPMIGTNEGLYPFLLIEAKRGVKAPGWAAIEAQTAFPLRRLLMLQESLQRKAGVHLDPLIWFFAYQGEEWRLYAGILREANVVRFLLMLFGASADHNFANLLCTACLRPLAWLSGVLGRFVATLADCRLSLDVGSRYLSTANTQLSLCFGTIHPGDLTFHRQ